MKLRWWHVAGAMIGIGLVGALVIIAVAVWLVVARAPAEANVPTNPVTLQDKETAPDTDSPASGSINRIAIVGIDGNVFTVSPDGEDKEAITEDATDNLTYRYPTWSPDASKLAYVELTTDNDSLTSALRIAPTAGGDTQRVETEFPPFYLYWSPTGDNLAFLSNWDNGMALRMVNVGSGEATTVREGTPFFFSWQPSGESLFAHIGTEELLFLNPEGDATTVDITGGGFQAPHWSPDGAQLVYARAGTPPNSQLVVSDANGNNAEVISEEAGVFTANWNPDNRRVAYSFTTQMVGLAAFGPLFVENLDTDERIEVSEDPVVAFFWSPDGTKLAYLTPEPHAPVERAPEAAPLRQEGELWVRWHIWDGEQNYPLTLFSPTESFVIDYIRYFDQYSQSVSIWSPDSESLVYAGLSESGLTGVWTMPVAEDSTPRRITAGVLAAWSPR